LPLLLPALFAAFSLVAISLPPLGLAPASPPPERSG
jgi:hypothetical protein